MINDFSIDCVNPTIILVISNKGELHRVNCPFVVRPRYLIAKLSPQKEVLVEEVKDGLDDVLIYIINGKPYFHWHFRIL